MAQRLTQIHLNLHFLSPLPFLFLQMENASSSSAFLSTLSEGEDLVFGSLYTLFGKSRDGERHSFVRKPASYQQI